jgi:DNA-binding helix-hairpin-helix protein with protein kinase domain
MQEVVNGTERVALGVLIGRGGEGEVYAVDGDPGKAVKIYSAGLRSKREDKVRAMVREGLAVKTNLVAYPGGIVADRHGHFLGFLMRLVSGYRPIHELYSPKSRLRHFQKSDYRFVLRAAVNVARAVGKVHQTGCVIGDLNHSGVLVGQDATVALIDADSFQFQVDGKTYPCVVGVPDFTPPELHGVHLGTVERTIEHDNFGLAVAIFHLLFMGRHPYAGCYNGPDISMGDAIAQNRFAYSLTRRSETQCTPPPGALTLDLFPAPIGGAFERAFSVDPRARPDASEWIDALARLEGSLSKCHKVKTHYYPSNAKDCVWCDRAGKSNFDMFPDLSVVASDIPTDTFGTEQAIREIFAFRFPSASDLLGQSVAPEPGGSSAYHEAKSAKRSSAVKGLLIMGAALAALILVSPLWFVWLGLGAWGLAVFSDRDIDVHPFRAAFEKADELVQQTLDAFIRRHGLTEALKVRADLDVAIAAYKSNDDALAREVADLKATREARHRASYLDQFSIRRANISGIGPAKTATLISFGIETAADVSQSTILRIPGFGDVTTAKLMEWRRSLDSRFRYNPTQNAQDIADERALRAKFARQKATLEATIRNGGSTLRAARTRIEPLPAIARSDLVLAQALEKRAQAEQDLRLLSASVPSSSVTLRLPPSLQPLPQPPLAPKAVTHFPPRPSGSHGVPNCPQCGAQMRRRSGRYGSFWGCSRYPQCRGTRKS